MRRAALFLVGWLLLLGGTAHATPPNILVILTDDQRMDTLSVMPNLQSLAAAGVTFTNAWVTTPLCTPSRTSVLTGQYAHHHGMRGNAPPYGGASMFPATTTIATALQAVGYTTGLFGKYLNDYSTTAVPPGWNQWQAFSGGEDYVDFVLNENGTLHTYEANYSTDLLRDRVLAFMATAPQPWFVLYAPKAPHVLTVSAPRHAGVLANLPPFRPLSWKEQSIPEKPKYWKDLKAAWDDSVIPAIDAFRRGQLETLLAVDEAVGAFHAAAPLNTLTIVTSDNGMTWGEHWDWYRKKSGYDESARVPLVITGPGVTSHLDTHLVANIDLAPTLAAMAGATLPNMDGRSLVPLLTNTATPWREDLLLEGWNTSTIDEPPTFAGVIASDGWKYLKTTEATGATVEELYDRTNDPGELTDKAETTQGRTRRNALRARLTELRP